MNIFGYATIITRVAPADTSGNDVYSGGIVRVWGFTVSNTSAGTVTATVRTNESSPTTLWSATIAANTTVTVPIPFIADKGLEVVASSANTLSFTFYHGQVGS